MQMLGNMQIADPPMRVERISGGRPAMTVFLSRRLPFSSVIISAGQRA